MGRGAGFDEYDVPAKRVHPLVKLAEEKGISEEDLDELVHDLASQNASERFNAAEGESEDEWEDLELLHGAASETASNINNSGLSGQIACLVDALGEEKARETLSSLK